tara:strand:- start:902 stop:1612 length:711 start_codon:yes stop_codon:yes gene_type:complete
MGLPKIDQPLFECTIPSTEKKITFRPFTVKEEKVLLIAREAGDMDQIVLAVKQIVGNCCNDLDVEKLAVFDLEYLMLQLRAKSVNNEVKFTIKDPDTEEEVELKLDIDDIQIVRDPDHTKKVSLNDQYYMMMRYPTINELVSLQVEDGKSEEQVLFDTMVSCIETLVDSNTDEVYNFSEFSGEEIEDFVDQFTSGTIAELQQFFAGTPKMKYSVEYTNKDGKEKTFTMEGVETFFT